MVAPLVEALLLRAMRRRADAATPRPTRLVGRPQVVDGVAYVADQTSALLLRHGGDLQVLTAGSLVLPTLLGGGSSTYVVVSHDPMALWLRIGPFGTRDERVVHQVELRLTVTLADSPSLLHDLAAARGPSGADGLGRLDDVGPTLLDRISREVSARTAESVHRHTLTELTGLSLGVLLDGALPATFLGGLVSRTGLEVVDVDWPTEGRSRPAALPPPAAPDPSSLSDPSTLTDRERSASERFAAPRPVPR